MSRIKVTLKSKPYPYPLIDKQVRIYARELEGRWRDVAPTLMGRFARARGFLEIKKAIEGDPDLYAPPSFGEQSGLAALLQDLIGADTESLIQRHTGRVFAYGALLANRGFDDDLTPPDAQDWASYLVQSPRAADNQAMAFVSSYSFAQIRSKDASTFGNLQTRLLEVLERREHPIRAAQLLASDLDEDLIGWTRIARTETARALAAGSLDEARRLGADHVYVPENGGACDDCQRLIVGRVFKLSDIAGKSNYKRKKDRWIAAVPLHPNCTDHTIPASRWLVDQAMAQSGGSVPKEGVKVAWVNPKDR